MQRDVIMLSAAVFKLVWLRSGGAEYAYCSYYLTSSGYRADTYSARGFAVRPALYKKASPWEEAPRSGDEGFY